MKFLSIFLLLSVIALAKAISSQDTEDLKGDPAVRRCAAHDECRPGWRCVGVMVGQC